MPLPPRYVVYYFRRSDPEDAAPAAKEFKRLAEARRFAASSQVVGASLYERVNCEDVTPPGDPAGLLWDCEERPID